MRGEEVETVSDFCYLGAIFTDCYDDTKEIKRRIAIANQARRNWGAGGAEAPPITC